MWFGIWFGLYLILGGALLIYVGRGIKERRDQLVRREVMREFLDAQPNDPVTKQFTAFYEQLWEQQDEHGGRTMDDIQLELGYLRDTYGSLWFGCIVLFTGLLWLPLVLYFYYTQKDAP